MSKIQVLLVPTFEFFEESFIWTQAIVDHGSYTFAGNSAAGDTVDVVFVAGRMLSGLNHGYRQKLAILENAFAEELVGKSRLFDFCAQSGGFTLMCEERVVYGGTVGVDRYVAPYRSP